MSLFGSSDSALVRQTLRGQREAFHRLVERYGAVAHAVAYAKLHSADDAEDVAQEAFVLAFEKLNTLREPAKFGPWLTSIVRNRAGRVRETRLRRATLAELNAAEPAAREPEVERREMEGHVREAVEALDETLREAVLLFYFAGKSAKETAGVLETTPAAVRKRLQRARDEMGERLLATLGPDEGRQKARAKRIMAALPAGLPWATAEAATGGAGALLSSPGVWIGAALIAGVLGITAMAPWEVNEGNTTASTNPTVAGRVDEGAPAADVGVGASSGSNGAIAASIAGAVESSSARMAREANEGHGEVTVTVVGPADVPAEGATVVLERVNWPAYEEPGDDLFRVEGTTDREGRTTFEDAPFGKYAVLAWNDYGAQTDWAFLGSEQREDAVALELWEGEPIGGRVVDEAGNPIAGAVLYVYESDREPGELLDTRVATSGRVYSDGAGRFQFPSLWIGEWRLYGKAEGFAAGVTDWVMTGSEGMALTLGEGATVAGTVVDQDTGEPLEGIEIVIRARFDRDQFTTASDGDGRFSFSHLREESYRMTIGDDLFVSLEPLPELDVPAHGTIDGVTLRLTRGATVSGGVYDEATGEPYGGVRINARPEHPNGIVRSDNRTDGDGRYTVTGLTSGAYEIQLHEVPGVGREHAADARQTIDVVVGETYEGVDFPVERGLSISGVVTDPEGAPLANVLVEGSTFTGAGDYRGSARSGGDGRWVVAGFEPGQSVQLTAEAEGFALHTVEPIALIVDDVEGVALKMVAEGVVEGRVIDEHGEPYARVSLSAQLGSDFGTSRGSAFARTDEDGNYRLEGMSPGTWSFFLSAHEGGSFGGEPDGSVELTVSEHRTGVDFELARIVPGTIRGRVIDHNGAPVPSVRVMSTNRDAGQHHAYTDASGNFVFDGIAEGEYSIHVTDDRYAQVSTQVKTVDAPIDVVVHPRPTVSGRVIAGDTGAPVERFNVLIHSGGPEDYDAIYETSARTMRDDGGTFDVDIVRPGENTLRVSAEGYAVTSIPLGDVAPGERRDGVDIVLRKGTQVEGVVTTSSGEPVSGARIFADELPRQHEHDVKTLAVTDGEGHFVATDLPPETTVLYAYRRDYVAARGPMPSGAGPVELVMGDGATVTGRVTMAGEPLQARITISSGLNEVERSELTDEAGHYEIPGVSVGEVYVRASIPRTERSQHYTITTRAGEITTVDFDLPRGGAAFSGHITMEGAPVAKGGITVTVGRPPESKFAQPDEEGHFRFDDLPEGEARVVAIQFDGTGKTRQKSLLVDFLSGEETMLDIELGGGQRIEGVVTGVPEGYRGSVVVYTLDADLTGYDPLDGERDQALQQCCLAGIGAVSETGELLVEGVEPGTYRVLVTISNPAVAQSGDIEAFRATMRATSGTVTVPEDGPGVVELGF